MASSMCLDGVGAMRVVEEVAVMFSSVLCWRAVIEGWMFRSGESDGSVCGKREGDVTKRERLKAVLWHRGVCRWSVRIIKREGRVGKKTKKMKTKKKKKKRRKKSEWVGV